MKISIELNDQELDIAIAGLEGLRDRLTVSGRTKEVVPVQSLMTRIIDAIEQAESNK